MSRITSILVIAFTIVIPEIITAFGDGGGFDPGIGDGDDGNIIISREQFGDRRGDLDEDDVTGDIAGRRGVYTCISSGDPHIRSYSGNWYHVQTACRFTMSRDGCSGGSILTAEPSRFHISAEFYRRNPDKPAAWNRRVIIELPSLGLEVEMELDKTVKVNGAVTSVPVALANDAVYIGSTYNGVFLSALDIGIQVIWNGNQLQIIANEGYAGKLCGLCGDFGFGNPEYDFGPSTDCATGSSTDLIDSWQYDSAACGQCTDEDEECDDDAAAAAACDAITDPVTARAPFQNCISTMNQQSPETLAEFRRSCIYDVCQAGSDVCDLAHDLVMLCQYHFSIRIDSWRDPNFCPLDCPQNSHYTTCANPCESDTCPANATDGCFSADACEEGCSCDEGYFWDYENELCVPSCDPTLPCDENPGVCNTGECLNVLSHPNGYVCDCVNTGMTGDHCEIPAGSQCGDFQGVYCKVCTGAASEAECDSSGTPTICPQADAVCELMVNYDYQGEIVSVSRSCIAHADCASQVLGDDDCNGYTGKRSVMARSAGRSCTTCEAGECFDKPECADDSLYCYRCHSHSESGCWVAGHYELCAPGSMCFYRNTKNSAGRDVFERGCMTQQQCLNPSSGLTCGLGMAEPPAPEKPLYSCSKPSVGTCFCKGDPHCMTADGVYIPQVSGPCLTTFVQDNCYSGQPEHSGTPSFVVAVNPDYLSNSKVAVQAVHITCNIGGTTTSIKFTTHIGYVSINNQAAVSIADNNNMVPYEVNGHIIEMVSADIVRVMLSNGVSIDWNFNKEVATHIPHSMMGSICGICGDFDGTPAGDYSGGPSNSGDCPNENNVSLAPGEAVTAGKEDDFAMSWFAGIDNNEPRCCESCGLNADQCQ